VSTVKQIIVLGGGYGGVLTAKKLAKRLKKQNARITLIDRSPYHTLLTELHEVAANRVEEDSIRIDLKKIFAGFSNVDVVLDEIEQIDFNGRKLQGKVNTYQYDYLVIGTGNQPTYFGTPGAEEHAFPLWSYEDAVRLNEHILNMFRRSMKELDPQKRKEMLTFVVVGAGFTGVEMVGELAEYVRVLCKEFNVGRSDVTLHIADMAPKILPILPDKLIRKSEHYLRNKLGVNIITGSKIVGVTDSSVQVGDQEIRTKTVIWTAGVEGSDLVGSVDVEQNGRKRIVVNDKLQVPEHEEVYVVGDNIFYIPEGEERPVPQMVENAEQSAPLVAHNISADFLNKPKQSYKPAFHGMMVSIGSRYGVANVGTPKKKMMLSGFFAMAIKHLINMWYLFQVAGFNKVYSYMLHEFFHVRNRRSIFGGHLSKRSPNFWLVPLRLFVGASWFLEGFDKLKKIIDDPDNIFLIPAKAVDGVSSATPAAEAEAIEALPVPDFIESIVSWSMDLFFYTSSGDFTTLAYVFQFGMVAAEIVFGLALFVGLFTAPSAIATVFMSIMIWASGMASQEILWYMVGGIALIGGSGSTLGLDYYVYPYLKRVWKKFPFVKRWYLYAD